MEELEIKMPEKLLIAISALGNHGKNTKCYQIDRTFNFTS